MTQLSGNHISYWIDSTNSQSFISSGPDDLDGVNVDVAIVGGGIAGITAATLLKRAGKTVAIVEADRIAAGVSGHTTAKITSLHQLIYNELIKNLGEDKAKLYAESNQEGIEQVASFVQEESIDCDFKRTESYTFAESRDSLTKIEEEVEAALKLGLPASFVKTTSLPFEVFGAVKFANQAEFHPRKYLLHLASKIPGKGSYVFEGARVEKVEEGEPCRVSTAKGTLTAQKVLVTTHSPILNEGLFFAKSYPQRSYIVGASIDPAHAPQGMFIGTGEGYRSIRTTPYQDGLLLLIGGEGHKTGTVTDTEERYLRLEKYGRERFGISDFAYRWSTQDIVSFDKLPYIGKLTPMSKHIYVATGFSLWGMSKGTMAGILLSDLLLGIVNPWVDLYDATRATPFITPKSIKNNVEVGVHWVGDRIKESIHHDSIEDIKRGEAKLITADGEKIAAFRDEEGIVHAVSAVCTHLGCLVNWNNAEKSWDCPCHGARFDCQGKVLHGPATQDLEVVSSKVRAV
jgi:glycine/D-amino acid oxidase-like deaminating enzyme/nitrite reductase/ring-hydroxylating ferredoxin subunit